MKQEETIRVLVVEDHAQTRDGICDYLRQQGMIVNEAGNTGDGLLLVQEWQPHVVVLDIVLPQRRGATAPFNQGNGIEAARQIKAHNSGIGIVFLSAHPHFRADVLELAKEGYAGIVYLFKGEQPAHELRDAIYAARDGRFILDRKISRTSVPAPAALSHSLTSEEEEKIEFAVAQFNLLTERELEVVNYLVGSLTNAGIAQALVITPNAVQTHLRNVYAKVGLGDKDELLDKRSLLAKAYIVYQNRQGAQGQHVTVPKRVTKSGSSSTAQIHQGGTPLLNARWRQWIIFGSLLYGLLAILLSVWPTIQLINRPYGGFLWSWDNQRGLYRVDESFTASESQLQKADFLLAVEGVTASPQLSQEVQHLYDQHTAACTPNLSPPQFNYTIERQEQQLQLTSPLACFQMTDWLRLVTLPLTIAFLVWLMGVIVFRANPQQEINATFAIFASFSTAVIAKQIFHEPGIHTLFSQTVAFLISAPAPILSAAIFLHLATLLPRQHPFTHLRRLGWLLYGLFPAALLLLGWWQFLAAAAWTPAVSKANTVWGIGNIFLRYSGPVLLIVWSLHLLRHSQHRQAVGQAKLIAISMAFSLFLVPFELTLHAPQFIRWWWPISQPALLFWTSLGFIGLAFAILRYQLFPGRMRSLSLLVIIFVSVLFSLVSTPLLQLPPGLLVPILFVMLLGISLFWSLPSPLQTTLRRFALPGIIREKELVQFNRDIQGRFDLEALPLQIVQSLETHLELSFAVLWLAQEPEIGILETYTDHAPAQNFPGELPLTTFWQAGVQRVASGVLADAGCEIALFLTVKEQKVGILGLGPRWTEDVFDDTDLQTLAVITQQAALALHTARQWRALSRVPLQMELAQLRERERIAQDLHDSTQARLTQLLFAMEKIRAQIGIDPALAELQVDTAVADVNQTALELRAILQNLLPQRRGNRTFIEALSEYLDRLKHLHPEVQIHIDAEAGIDDFLPENDQLGLLRVCQQAVDNALQHGQPTNITLNFQLHLEEKQLSFAVSDNGRGFVMGKSTNLLAQGHHGLHIMEARVKQQGGQLQVQSTPDKGTTVLGYVQLKAL